MSFLANILWIFFGGLFLALQWFVLGLLLCITIIGIPLGTQCFKMAALSLSPFGTEVIYGGGGVSFLTNLIWMLLCGWWLALEYLFAGAAWCITIIGIPVGLQCFKMAKLSLMPFGSQVV